MKHISDRQLAFDLAQSAGSDALPLRETLAMQDADVCIYRDFFDKEESNKFFRELSTQTTWRQDQIKIYGKEVKLPRLTACYGDSGKDYSYSGISMLHIPWTPSLIQIKRRVDEVAGVSFNSVLLNLYRDGDDRLSWHQDDEPELGVDPIIGSVSFGSTRRFQFKHKYIRGQKNVNVDLTHGSVLVMKGSTQRFWLHQIPRTTKSVGPRINLTFRHIR